MTKQVLAADLGGTNLRFALVDEDYQRTELHKVRVPFERFEQQCLDFIASSFSKLDLTQVSAVAMGVPGIVNSQDGVVYASPHYPSWKNFEFVKRLQEKIKKPVLIDNDAHMIAEGELLSGQAKDWKNFILITLGTGIGGAFVINREIFSGDYGLAAEFGHIIIDKNGLECACGSTGCFETLVSATALHRELSAIPDLSKITSNRLRLMAEEARKDHPEALRLFSDFAKNLGIGLASLIQMSGIHHLILGGGLVHFQDLFFEKMQLSLKAHLYEKSYELTEIRPTHLGDDSGLLGAASRAFAYLETKES